MTTRIVILGTQRSGTTALRKCMASLDHVHAFGELFYPNFFEDGFHVFYQKKMSIDRTLQLPRGREKCYGMYFGHLDYICPTDTYLLDLKYSDMDVNSYLFDSICSSTTLIVHLRRANQLKCHVSNMIMSHRIETAKIDEAIIHSEHLPERVKVNIELADLEAYIRDRVNKLTLFEEKVRFYARDFVSLKYEGLFEPVDENTTKLNSRATQELSPILDIKSDMLLTTKLRKQNSDKLSDIVENYDELYQLFMQTEYFYMLD